MSFNKLLPVLGRCKGKHKQCDKITESIQNEFNLQYWSFKKVDQDNCLLRSIKISKKNGQNTYRYFIFGIEVCSQMFIKTLGYKTKSRIEYLFSKLRQIDNLNQLELLKIAAITDGRKNNRVKSREHDQKFLEELYNFVNSFVSNKKKNHLIIENYKPIDLFRKLCDKLDYKVIYEDNNIKVIKNTIQSNDQLNNQNLIKQNYQLNQDSNSEFSINQNTNQQNKNLIDNYNDESVTMTNETKLYINEMSNSVSNSISNNLINNDNQSQFINQQSNSQQFTIQNNNNFISFSQILDQNINNFIIQKNTGFKVNISNQNVNVSSNLIETSNLNRSPDKSSNLIKTSNLNKSTKTNSNEICSFSYFVRFLKKNKFEFR